MELPFITVIVFGTAKAMTTPQFWIMTLAAMALLHYFIQNHLKTPVGRYARDYLLLRLPALGGLLLSHFLHIFFLNLAAMLECGLTLIESLRIMRDTFENIIIRNLIDSIIDTIIKGGSIGDSISDMALVPRFARDLIQAGESTGELPDMLRKAAQLLEDDIDFKTETFLKLFEPLLIGLLALMVDTIMIAILLPISNAVSTFSQ